MPVKNEFDNDPIQDTGKNNNHVYWRKWYAAVIVFLLAQIVFYYLITQHFK